MQFVINNWYLFLALIVVITLLMMGPITQFMHGIKNATPAEVVQLVNRQSGIVVDISEPDEFKNGHIPNAVNAPLSKLSDRLKQLEKYKDKPVVVSCRMGNRSIKGAVALRKQGFASVHALAGGLAAWERANLPLEK